MVSPTEQALIVGFESRYLAVEFEGNSFVSQVLFNFEMYSCVVILPCLSASYKMVYFRISGGLFLHVSKSTPF